LKVKIQINNLFGDVSNWITKTNPYYTYNMNVLTGEQGYKQFKFNALNTMVIQNGAKIQITDDADKIKWNGYIVSIIENTDSGIYTVRADHELTQLENFYVTTANLSADIEGTDGIKKGTVGSYKFVQAFHLLDTLFAEVDTNYALDYSGVEDEVYSTITHTGYTGYRFFKYLRLDVEMFYCVGQNLAIQDYYNEDERGLVNYFDVFLNVIKLMGLIIYEDHTNSKYVLKKYAEYDNPTLTDNNTTKYKEKTIQTRSAYLYNQTSGSFGYGGTIDDYYQTVDELNLSNNYRYMGLSNEEGLNVKKISLIKNLSVGFHCDYYGTNEWIDCVFSSLITEKSDCITFYTRIKDLYENGFTKKTYTSLAETIEKSYRTESIGYDINKELISIVVIEESGFKITAADPANGTTQYTNRPSFDVTFGKKIDRSTVIPANITFIGTGTNTVITIIDDYNITITSDSTITNGTYDILFSSDIRSFTGDYLALNSSVINSDNTYDFTTNDGSE